MCANMHSERQTGSPTAQAFSHQQARYEDYREISRFRELVWNDIWNEPRYLMNEVVVTDIMAPNFP